jgi:hypothetical protein
MKAALQFLINTLLQRGVLPRPETQNRFNGFHTLSKTAEEVGADSSRMHTPLKQGVDERNPT